MHTLLDGRDHISYMIRISDGVMGGGEALDHLSIQPRAYGMMGCRHIEFNRPRRFENAKACFMIRGTKNPDIDVKV